MDKRVFTRMAITIAAIISGNSYSYDLEIPNFEIGTISRTADFPHCTAFAISKNFLVTSSDCINQNYAFEPTEESFIYKGSVKDHIVYVEALYPQKKKAYLRAKGSPDFEYLNIGFGKASAFITPDVYSGKATRENITEKELSFIENNFLYHKFDTYEHSAGSPLLNARGEYVGVHQGSAWYKGEYLNIATYRDRKFDVFKTVSYESEVK